MSPKAYQIGKIVYVALSAILALYATVAQIQPALYWMQLIADNEGSYSVKIAFGLTWISLLLPLILFVIVTEVVLKKKV